MIDHVSRFFVFVIGAAGMLAALSAVCQADSMGRLDVDFVKEIKPIFEQHCLSCHGPEKEENFRIDDVDATLSYVESTAEKSDLYLALISDDEDVLMPPPGENNPLDADQIALIKKWIEEGATWPEDVEFSMPTKAAATQESVPQDMDPGDENTVPAQDIPAPANPPTKGLGERIWIALGPLHPAAVHLPIGLLLGAGFFALFGLRGNFVMSDCAYYCLWLGALSCIVASVLGWSYAITENHDTNFNNLFKTDEKIFLHRITGIATSIFALLLALYASAARAADPDDGLLWKLGAIILALAVGFVGHTGGELQYGKNHYKNLYGIMEELTGWEIDGKDNNAGQGRVKAFEPAPAIEEEKDPEADSGDNDPDPTGKTSGESAQ